MPSIERFREERKAGDWIAKKAKMASKASGMANARKDRAEDVGGE
jgi:hypothetical protein